MEESRRFLIMLVAILLSVVSMSLGTNVTLGRLRSKYLLISLDNRRWSAVEPVSLIIPPQASSSPDAPGPDW